MALVFRERFASVLSPLLRQHMLKGAASDDQSLRTEARQAQEPWLEEKVSSEKSEWPPEESLLPLLMHGCPWVSFLPSCLWCWE